MGIAAIIGLAVSIFGVGLVWITFQETKFANEIAKRDQRAWVRLSAKPRKSWTVRL